ncbi:hypothetical protein L1887_57720 [Cichorium endivia]|nr:hypothetical protein L1887_57720 [Cichorium endivia]
MRKKGGAVGTGSLYTAKTATDFGQRGMGSNESEWVTGAACGLLRMVGGTVGCRAGVREWRHFDRDLDAVIWSGGSPLWHARYVLFRDGFGVPWHARDGRERALATAATMLAVRRLSCRTGGSGSLDVRQCAHVSRIRSVAGGGGGSRLGVAAGGRVGDRVADARAARAMHSLLLSNQHLQSYNDLDSDARHVHRRQAGRPAKQHDEFDQVACLDARHVVHVVDKEHLGNACEATGTARGLVQPQTARHQQRRFEQRVVQQEPECGALPKVDAERTVTVGSCVHLGCRCACAGDSQRIRLDYAPVDDPRSPTDHTEYQRRADKVERGRGPCPRATCKVRRRRKRVAHQNVEDHRDQCKVLDHHEKNLGNVWTASTDDAQQHTHFRRVGSNDFSHEQGLRDEHGQIPRHGLLREAHECNHLAPVRLAAQHRRQILAPIVSVHPDPPVAVMEAKKRGDCRCTCLTGKRGAFDQRIDTPEVCGWTGEGTLAQRSGE